MKTVYLDNSASTRVFPEVAQKMCEWMQEDYGNAAALHFKGLEAEKLIRTAREQIAKTLKVSEKEILFTSGGTESDNTAIFGAAYANHRAGKHLITTAIEHAAVHRTMEELENEGFEVTYLPVDENGIVRLEDVERALRDDTILVSVMFVNNVVGSIQPIREIGELIKRRNPNIVFHVDAVQAYGKLRIQPKKMHIDLMSVSAHKLHGPKGVGFLYVAEKTKMLPFIVGGGQQKGMRSGTENAPGCAGMALAATMMYEKLEEDTDRLFALKNALMEGILSIPETQINGRTGRDSAPHVISASFRGVRAEVLLHALEDRGICVSAGSACSSKHPQLAGGTLRAMGVEKALLESTLRFSISLYTTMEEIEYTIQVLRELIPMLRKYTRH